MAQREEELLHIWLFVLREPILLPSLSHSTDVSLWLPTGGGGGDGWGAGGGRQRGAGRVAAHAACAHPGHLQQLTSRQWVPIFLPALQFFIFNYIKQLCLRI